MSATPVYLCYDLKGIQSFIFAVPRMRYISGGSAIIDRFDSEIAKGLSCQDATCLFAGGGKGAFHCASNEVATTLQEKLVQAAYHERLSIAIGRHEVYSEAANNADRLFPWLPASSELDGPPCADSGLYPVQDEDDVHPAIQARAWKRGDALHRRYEEALLKKLTLPSYIGDPGQLTFMHNVDARDEEYGGKCGAAALGNRNRWAIIYMDGNDMGNQHRKAMEQCAKDPQKLIAWISAMSKALNECCWEACRSATQYMLKQWASYPGAVQAATNKADGTVHLPIRPLIVGGDDIVVLCHARYAFDFVREAIRVFGEESEKHNKASAIPLWPATGGRLSITAGVLIAPVGLPLSTAVPYAESLMASAKGHGRKLQKADEPTPACIDWESVTEGVLDTPAARRQRDALFYDPDINELVSLTRKPYTDDDFKDLLDAAHGLKAKNGQDEVLPRTIRHAVMNGLKQSYWERQIARARMGKHHAILLNYLEEPEVLRNNRGRWQKGIGKYNGKDHPLRSTDLVDILSLLEEDDRMDQQTVEKDY